MDLNLIVKVRSFFSLPDGGPKSWRQGKTLPTQMVDIDNYGLMQLVDFIAEHYMWGSKQYISLWRELDERDRGCVRATQEGEGVNWVTNRLLKTITPTSA